MDLFQPILKIKCTFSNFSSWVGHRRFAYKKLGVQIKLLQVGEGASYQEEGQGVLACQVSQVALALAVALEAWALSLVFVSTKYCQKHLSPSLSSMSSSLLFLLSPSGWPSPASPSNLPRGTAGSYSSSSPLDSLVLPSLSLSSITTFHVLECYSRGEGWGSTHQWDTWWGTRRDHSWGAFWWRSRRRTGGIKPGGRGLKNVRKQGCFIGRES